MEGVLKKPKALKKGDTIGIVSPAAPLLKESLELSKKELIHLGYKVKFASNIESSYGYLAGKDEERAKAFMDIWLDPEVDSIWSSRGGYGSTRILPHLDFKKIKQHPKMFIGMSDITALHIALGQNASLVSYLGPTLSCLFTPKENPQKKFMHDHCWDFLSHPKKGHNYSYSTLLDHPCEVIKEGVAEGKLVGGNLSLITSLIGTPWQLETKGKILILEDVNEAPYRIDRMLNQLKLSGSLEHLSGLILGTFKDCSPRCIEKSLSLSQVFKEYFSKMSYPSLLGFPTGHTDDQVTLPLQCKVKLDTTSKTLKLLEPAVRAEAL